MSRALVIVLPVPARKLSPNGRTHWRRKAVLTKSARNRARLVTLQALGEHYHARGLPVPAFAGYSLAHFFPTAQPRDDDNADAACKAYRDGIADALGIDDRQLPKIALSTTAKDSAQPRVEITLHPSLP